MTLRLRLASVVYLSEIQGWWIKGRLRRDESVLLEARLFDPRRLDVPLYPGVPIVYLGLFSRGRFFFEYQDGWLDRAPDSRTLQDVADLSHALQGYNHFAYLRSLDNATVQVRGVATGQPGFLPVRAAGGRRAYRSVSGGPPRASGA